MTTRIGLPPAALESNVRRGAFDGAPRLPKSSETIISPTKLGMAPNNMPSIGSSIGTPNIGGVGGAGISGTSQVGSGPSFSERLKEVVNGADEIQKTSDKMSTDFAEGNSYDIHGTMIALQRADISLRFVSNIRNRVLEAYREVMRMGA